MPSSQSISSSSASFTPPYPSSSGDRGALLSQIQQGKRLKPAKTNDRSAPSVAGKTKDSTTLPKSSSSMPLPSSNNSGESGGGPLGLGGIFAGGIPKLKSRSGGITTGRSMTESKRRISAEWFGSLSSDQLAVETTSSPISPISPSSFTTINSAAQQPTIQTYNTGDENVISGDEVDYSKEFKVKTLYPYSGGVEDLKFDAGSVFIAHPSKNEKNADWWYGVVEETGAKGWFPKSYVEIYKEEKEISKAKVLYDYEARNSDELNIKVGNIISILDKSLNDWWKAEYEGVKGIIPSNYVEEILNSSEENNDNNVDFNFNFNFDYDYDYDDDNESEKRPRMMRQNSYEFGLLSASHLPSSRPGSPVSPGQGPSPITWSSVMNTEKIEQLTKQEQKRQEAIYELITTERSYLRDLQMIIQVFYGPLQQRQQNFSLTDQELSTIFSNIQDILICNTEILSDMEQRQNEQEFLVECIGDVMLNHSDNLKCYVEYCGGQLKGNPQCGALGLSSFLLKPMQRITRYPLLLRQILHYTTNDHPDHQNMMKTLQNAEMILEETNEAAREQENDSKLREISKLIDLEGLNEKLDLISMTRFMGKRQFLLEGPLRKTKSGRKLYGYLFNDIFLLCQQNKNAISKGYQYSLYKPPMPLNEIFVKEVGHDGTCFQIIHIQQPTNLKANDISVKKQWLNHLNAASETCMKAVRQDQNNNKDLITPVDSINGTLRVLISDGVIELDPSVNEKININVYCQLQLNRQIFKTKVIKDSLFPYWNQYLMFSVTTLEDTLKISIYNYDKYSQDEFLGQAEIGLKFLELYGDNNETDLITLPLKNVAAGRSLGTISIYLSYKATR
ncbi:8066_t:CDS:10 [Entrophospora sp. SA101]|nr:8066_t:CDS:10 [Entrophospora sp. SA101]